jgi:hypothetical protein
VPTTVRSVDFCARVYETLRGDREQLGDVNFWWDLL